MQNCETHLYFQTTNDIQPTLNLRREKYAKYRLNLGMQAIIVGASVDFIKHSYVIINEIFYKVETPLKAIDIAFKSMYALDSKYPAECTREWFLQEAVYGILSDKNINDLTALALIEEYVKFKAN